MAGLWQRFCSLWQDGVVATLIICLFFTTSSADLWDAIADSYALEGFEMVRGNFSRNFLHVGYNKIAEIPAGACNISIQEMRKSRNYLALLTQTGNSIINGNWVIDRPGTYSALGTQLTYKRPNEIRSRDGESITAPGPLIDDLHLYLIYQQPGPSVHYEYSIPVIIHPSPESEASFDSDPPEEITDPSDESVNEEEMSNIVTTEDTSQPKNNMFETHISFVPRAAYTWKRTGHTECSRTCGTGKRHIFWECIDSYSQVTVPVGLCHLVNEPANQEEDCNKQPCPAYWDVGEWSECSRRCGPGIQLRQVICRRVTQVHANGTEIAVSVAAELCGSSEMPVTQSVCQLKICSQWEIRSDWSPCSMPCGVGQRSRDVVCVSNQGDVDDERECNVRMKPEALQNCDMGVCARSWFTSLWSQRCTAECGIGNKTRSVVCLLDHATDLPLKGCEGERPPNVTSCDASPCQNQTEWFTGPWGQCSTECGDGTQTRSALCVFTNNGHKEVVDSFRCSREHKPITSQPCRLKPCGVQWYVTEWSTCSRSCNSGYRVREVRCLADNIVPSDKCNPMSMPQSQEECNKHLCQSGMNPLCTDQYQNCTLVVQARLCIYPYYRRVCCSSCSRAQKTYPTSFFRNHIRK